MESEREEVKNGGVEEDERALKRKREKEWAASSPPPLDEIADDQDNAFKMVKPKNGIHPSDITMDIGKGVPICWIWQKVSSENDKRLPAFLGQCSVQIQWDPTL
ncbi:unnamed protein product [Brassica oleracea]